MLSGRENCIEIGCGFSPTMPYLRSDLLGKDPNCVYLDIDIRSMKSYIKNVERGLIDKEIKTFTCGNGEALPFATNGLGLIVFKNFLYHVNTWSFKEEIKRVCAENGKIVLIETEGYADWRSVESHFCSDNILHSREHYFGESVNRIFDKPGIYFPENSFALVFIKKTL